MKTVLLVRHAKSSWDDASVKDFDRTLNERGKKNAPEMAARIVKRKIDIGLLISSPAKRAKTTAILFGKEFKMNEADILFDKDLYHAEPSVFFNIISNIDDKYKSIAVFAHNPGITEFANLLTAMRIDNIPTCGVFAIAVEIERWNDFNKGKKNFLFFDYPKSGLD
ncbi:MAG: histidine phosphatase family protein [Bacteroidetes bacterium]|nr:histidine phosphatase family protein [Bacteroidota bacterium]